MHQALQHAQSACQQYERAMSEHTAAREMVHLAEEGLMNSGCAFDHTWQEMLNHASAKVSATTYTNSNEKLLYVSKGIKYI